MTIEELAVAVIDACDDARDVLAVQGVDSLDLERIQMWCDRHDRTAALKNVVAEVKRFAGEP